MNYRRTSSRPYPYNTFSSNVPIRRRSCYCEQCGRQSEFQILSNSILPLQIQLNMEKMDSEQKLKDEIQKLNRNERTQSTTATNSNHEKQPKKSRRTSCCCQECGQISLFQQKHKDLPFIKPKRQPKVFLIKKKNPQILKHSRTLQLEQMQSRSKIDPTQLIQKKKQMISLRNIETRLNHRRIHTEYGSFNLIALPAIKDQTFRTYRKCL